MRRFSGMWQIQTSTLERRAEEAERETEKTEESGIYGNQTGTELMRVLSPV